MLRAAGLLLLVLCGAAGGIAAADKYKRRYDSLCSTADMLSQMQIMLGFEAPTVSQMLSDVKKGMEKPPAFLTKLSDEPSVSELSAALDENADGFEERDLQKLKELFSHIGSSDKSGEERRLAEAERYFSRRARSSEAETARQIKLAKSLGILAGIFAAVILA